MSAPLHPTPIRRRRPAMVGMMRDAATHRPGLDGRDRKTPRRPPLDRHVRADLSRCHVTVCTPGAQIERHGRIAPGSSARPTVAHVLRGPR